MKGFRTYHGRKQDPPCFDEKMKKISQDIDRLHILCYKLWYQVNKAAGN